MRKASPERNAFRSPAMIQLEYVAEQCDEKYEGRLTGTAGYQMCAEWLAGEFAAWGPTLRRDDGAPGFSGLTYPIRWCIPNAGSLCICR
ncbi:MAG: hypothetical protein MZV63_40830 [Marinilabiliales bacterium]|nr:hypothetical protein [Marinilabiliales bacterium]